MYNDIISLKNLHEAWNEFVVGKKYKKDVAEFSLNLPESIFLLHTDLKNKTYRHGTYQSFSVNDPKPRSVHKASVRDRLLHHAIYRVLYPRLDKKFIYDSYSCRNNKGTHRALNRFRDFGTRASFGHTKTVWVLKCDIRKFFASIDHALLVDILGKWISDADTLSLFSNVIDSFDSGGAGKGLPLGNLTSQLFANVYMNEFDQFVKHTLKVAYYIRYADDFVIFSHNKNTLAKTLRYIARFLRERLKLELHPDKVFIKTLASGVDFLGWIHFPTHRVLRTATRRRMFRRLAENPKEETVVSYLGLLSHGNTHKLRASILKIY